MGGRQLKHRVEGAHKQANQRGGNSSTRTATQSRQSAERERDRNAESKFVGHGERENIERRSCAAPADHLQACKPAPRSSRSGRSCSLIFSSSSSLDRIGSLYTEGFEWRRLSSALERSRLRYRRRQLGWHVHSATEFTEDQHTLCAFAAAAAHVCHSAVAATR